MPAHVKTGASHRPVGLGHLAAAIVAVPVGLLIAEQLPDSSNIFVAPTENVPRFPDVRTDAPVLRPHGAHRRFAPDSRTAIYNIAKRTLYLPDGRRLEAHSGLGNYLDDRRYVDVANHGPTPPNTYNLVLREQRFHGVRAIRLVPVDGRRMFGRTGILAHSYMLGPSGQSNGCVSIRNYPLFLDAFMRGDVNRLVVV
jgi:hypothetical protein